MTVENTATGRGPFGARRFMPLIVWVSVALGVLVLILTGEMGNMIDAFSECRLVAHRAAAGGRLRVAHRACAALADHAAIARTRPVT